MKKKLQNARKGVARYAPAILLFCFSAYAQSPNCYRITFSDKNNSPYSVNRPEEFLSQRAIAKRERFNIPVTVQDLPVNPHYIDSILNFSSEPSQIISKSKWDNSVVIFYPETESCYDIINEIINHFSFVVDTLPVAYYKLPFISEKQIFTQITENNDDARLFSSSCDYNYGRSVDNIKLHKGELLHKAGFCGEGMLICIIDGGFEGFDTISYFKHLFANGQILGTRDLIPGINNVFIGTGMGHGTGVASILLSSIEGKLVGTAPKANYFFINSENSWSENLVEEDFWAQAAEIADSLGADVISSSIGYTNSFDYEWQNIYTIADIDGKASIASRAASILAQKGVIVVQAAGNDGWNPAWKYIGHPADAFNILAVGCVLQNGDVMYSSSYGPTADGRIKPDVVALGENVWYVNSAGKIKNDGGYTSAAAPIIAGLSACLWQALPQYSSLEIMQLIREYGDQANNPDNKKGYGVPNFYQCYLDHTNSVPENKKFDVEVYPNPTTGELSVETHRNASLQSVEIFDIYGRKCHVSRVTRHENNINISHLRAGIYFLKIETEKGMNVKKIIKY